MTFMKSILREQPLSTPHYVCRLGTSSASEVLAV
jgi:hypothetical protein